MKFSTAFAAFCVIGAASQAVAGPEGTPLSVDLLPVRASADAPWFQTFTFGSGYSSDLNGWSANGVQGDSSNIRVTTQGKRWGMALGVRNKKDWEPLSQHGARDKLSAGAFYNITPRVQFGGEMTLESKNSKDGVEPGVKFGSAFRF